MLKNIFAKIALVLLIICLPILLLSGSIAIAANGQWLYEFGFEKYDVSRTTNIAPEELSKAASGLISYFNSNEEYIDVVVEKNGKPFTLFNERESIHLKDVKALFRLDYYLLGGTLFYTLIFLGVSLLAESKRRFRVGIMWGSALTLMIMVLLGAGMATNFEKLFRQFHLLSFANDMWLLNPATDYLIMLFPGGFWLDAAVFCAVVTAVPAVIFGGLSLWYLQRERRPL